MAAQPAAVNSTIATLEIRLDLQPYHVRAPVWVHLLLQNRSLETLEIGVSTPASDFEYELSLAGRSVSRTAYGQQLLDEAATSKLTIKELGPDDKYECSVDLTELFVISSAGHYRLSVQRRIQNPRTGKWELVRGAPVELSIER